MLGIGVGKLAKQLIAALGICVLNACVSSSRPPEIPITVASAATWADLVGLTQDEVRSRLGLNRSGKNIVSLGVWLDGEDVMSAASINDIALAPCSEETRPGYRVRTKFARSNARFNFRNGRFESAEVQYAGPQKLIPMNEAIGAHCVFDRSPTLVEGLGHGQTAAVLPVAVISAPVLLATKSSRDAAAVEQLRIFSELRLGEPPPGGVDAFIAQYSQHVRIGEDFAQRPALFVRTPSQIGNQESRAILDDGIVVALYPFGRKSTCRLRDDRSLLCRH